MGLPPSQQHNGERALAWITLQPASRPTREGESQPCLPSTQTGGTKSPEMPRREVGKEADPASTSNMTASVIARLGGLVRNTALFLQPVGLSHGFSLWKKGQQQRAPYLSVTSTGGEQKGAKLSPGMEPALGNHAGSSLTCTKGTHRRAELWCLNHCQEVFGLH